MSLSPRSAASTPRAVPRSVPALYSVLDRHYAGRCSVDEARAALAEILPQLAREVAALGDVDGVTPRELCGCPRCRGRGGLRLHGRSLRCSCGAVVELDEVLRPPWPTGT